MIKKTPNAERRTSNAQKCGGAMRTAVSEFEIGRWTLGVERLLF